MLGPIAKGIGLAASPRGRRVIRGAVRFARSDEGRKVIAEARRVATGPEARRLAARASGAARRANEFARAPENQERVRDAVRRLRSRT
jgi:hypothetical protein